MRTDAKLLSRKVAVPTQDLERRIIGKSKPLESRIKSAWATHLFPVCDSVAFDMIDVEKSPVRFLTAGTFTTVGHHNFFSYTSTGRGVGHVCFVFTALTNNALVIWAKILAALYALIQTALFGVSLSSVFQLLGRATSAEDDRPIRREFVSAVGAEAVRPAMFVMFPLVCCVLGHMLISPLNNYTIPPTWPQAEVEG